MNHSGDSVPTIPELHDLLHRSANDTSVLLALADLVEADPARVSDLVREIRRRCPAFTESLRQAVCIASGSRSAPSGG